MPNQNPDCLFCKIVQRQINAAILYQDDQVTAFRDINPKAPVHFLVVPNDHIPGVGNLTAQNAAIVSVLVQVGNRLASQEGVTNGYRLVINEGPDRPANLYPIYTCMC